MSRVQRGLAAGVVIPAVIASSIAFVPGASAATVNVNKAPIHALGGSATQLGSPTSIARDAAGRLYVLNSAGIHITVYAPTAHGNVAPIRTITAPGGMGGLAVTPGGTLAVTLQGAAGVGSVLVYAPNTTVPARIINGAATGIDEAYGVAIAPNGSTFVTNSGDSSITVYGATADGDVAPIRRITGVATTLSSPTGIALRTDGAIVVANYGNHGILTFGPTQNGNAVPIRKIFGPATDLQSPHNVALDTANRIYQTSPGLNQVKVYAANANGNVEPLVRNEGPATTMSSPYGMSVLPDGQYSVANVGTGRITTYASFFDQVQRPLNSCVRSVVVPKRAVTLLMRANCLTNAGQAVRISIRGLQDEGGIPRYRVRFGTNSSALVRTFGASFRFRVSWTAPATVTHRKFSRVRFYSG